MDILVVTLAAGFVLGIPALGPASAISYRRILCGDRSGGIAFAAGYILADGLACLAALWSVDFLLESVPVLTSTLRWVGLGLVAAVGLYFLAAGGTDQDESRNPTDDAGRGWLPNAGVALGMTLFNPSLFAGWTTAAGVALSVTGIDLTPWQKWTVPAAIAAGEALWYAVFLGAVSHWEEALDATTTDRIVRGLGGLLVAFAAWSALRMGVLG